MTANPTSALTGQQLVEAFLWATVPRYLLHDRDAIFSHDFRRRVQGMGIEEIRTAFRSPWQNPYCERLIGPIRHECLDHVVVLNMEFEASALGHAGHLAGRDDGQFRAQAAISTGLIRMSSTGI